MIYLYSFGAIAIISIIILLKLKFLIYEGSDYQIIRNIRGSLFILDKQSGVTIIAPSIVSKWFGAFLAECHYAKVDLKNYQNDFREILEIIVECSFNPNRLSTQALAVMSPKEMVEQMINNEKVV